MQKLETEKKTEIQLILKSNKPEMAADGETEDIFFLGDKDEYSDFIGTKGV